MRVLYFLIWTMLLPACNSLGNNEETADLKEPVQHQDSTIVIKITEPEKGSVADIPPAIEVKGVVLEVWKWKDKLGDNLLITSVVAPFDDKAKNEFGEEGQTAELLAYHYAGVNGNFREIWSLSETEKSCPFDITCQFIKDAISVTDLDKDQIAETTVQYKIACRSDVSPAEMKLVMHEGADSYTLDGLMWLKTDEKDLFTVTENDANLEKLAGYKGTEEEYLKTFGRYKTEKDFMSAPGEFIQHARSRWIRFVKETF